jgi:hypothetical protein
MEHALSDSRVKLWVDIGIRKLSRNDGIHLLHSPDFVLLLQEDEQMHMRKYTLLIFNSVHKTGHLPIIAIMNLLEQCLLFGIEDTCDYIELVHSCLTWMRIGQYHQ